MPNDYTFWRVYYSVTPKYFSKLVHADYIREIDGTLTEDSNPVLITGSRK